MLVYLRPHALSSRFSEFPTAVSKLNCMVTVWPEPLNRNDSLVTDQTGQVVNCVNKVKIGFLTNGVSTRRKSFDERQSVSNQCFPVPRGKLETKDRSGHVYRDCSYILTTSEKVSKPKQ
jgi:hypothetical protein